MDSKEIAKEIIVTMLEKEAIIRSEYPESETAADAVSTAYKIVLKAVRES